MGVTGNLAKGLAAAGAVAAGTVAARRWAARDAEPSRIDAVVTIGRPRAEVWTFLRKPESHAAVVPGLDVTVASPAREGSTAGERWRARYVAPADFAVLEWEIETLESVPEERLVLHTTPGSAFDAVSISRLADAPGGGTELRVEFELLPSAGPLGALPRAAEPVSRRGLAQVLRRARQLLETGEIPTTDGQPRGSGS